MFGMFIYTNVCMVLYVVGMLYLTDAWHTHTYTSIYRRSTDQTEHEGIVIEIRITQEYLIHVVVVCPFS